MTLHTWMNSPLHFNYSGLARVYSVPRERPKDMDQLISDDASTCLMYAVITL